MMYTVNCSYTGLGYNTGIRTYRTPRISVPQKKATVCLVHFGFYRIYVTTEVVGLYLGASSGGVSDE